jgi:hypothetical protein
MVRTPHQSHIRLRPLFHVPLCKGTMRQIANQTKRVRCIPPPNRQIIRTEEPIGGTIPPFGNQRPTRRLEALAPLSHLGSQQPIQRNHQNGPKSGIIGLSPNP